MAEPEVTIPQPVSSGATDRPNVPQEGGPPPVPAGFSDTPPSAPPTPAGFSDNKPSTESGQDKTGAAGLGQYVENIGENAAKGLEGTVAGLGELLKKSPQVALTEKLSGHEIIPQAGLNAEKAQSEQGVGGTAEQALGYGGESLLELISGDEALKGLSLSEKMLQTGKVAQILEKAPRLMEYLKLGASAGKAMADLSPEELAAVKKSPLLTRLIGTAMDSLRAGVVSGAQKTVQTGGDVKAGAEAGATQAAASGVLGTAFNVLGRVGEKAGEAGKAVEEASAAGKNAPTNLELGQKVSDQINDAETKMHGDFESGIQKLKGDLGDQKVPYQGSPLQKAAKATLEGITDKQTIPGKEEVSKILDESGQPITKQGEPKTVRTAKGALPEFGSLAGGSPESKNILTALADPKKEGDLTIDELIQRRQQLGEKIGVLTKGGTSSADRADVSVYQKLRDGIDDTISNLAKQSGKPEAAQDYEALRAAYKDKVKLFQNPAMQAMSAPGVASETKLDNVRKYLLAGGGKIDKVNTLSEVIGDQGVKDLGRGIIQRDLADASSNGQINPAKFVKNFKQIDNLPPEVKEKLFDMGAVDSVLGKLSKDLKTAANYQKLVRGGILGSAGGSAAAVVPHGGIGLLLGTLGAGDFGAASDLLDKLANRPGMWSAFRTAGKIGATLEESPAARRVGTAAKYGAGNALGNVLQGAKPLAEPEEDRTVYTNQ